MRTIKVKGSLLAVAAAVSIAGCQSTRNLNDGDISEKEGQAIGAVIGAAAGHQIEGGTLGTVIGAVAGAMIGGEIAENEVPDEAFAGNESVALRTESGKVVHVKPVDSFERDGNRCREYELRTEDSSSTQRTVACETSPGTWRVASAD